MRNDAKSCNFDSCVLYLPRWNEEQTVAAIKAAGIYGFKSRFLNKICFMLGNPVYAQGNRRTIQAETIEEMMRAKGYNTGMYYQMD